MTGSTPEAWEEVRDTLDKWTKEMYRHQGELGSRGEYAAADRAGGYCDTLRAWLAEAPPHEASHVEIRTLADPGSRNSMESTPLQLSRSAKNLSATIKSPGRIKPGTAGFTRMGDKYLVRSGVSKKSTEEYRHFAPYDLIVDLAHACLECTATGTPSFTMKDLKSNKDLKKKEHSVGYYYDVLKWFGQIAFVERAGLRGRYKLGRNYAGVNDPFGMLKGEFQKLPEESTDD